MSHYSNFIRGELHLKGGGGETFTVILDNEASVAKFNGLLSGLGYELVRRNISNCKAMPLVMTLEVKEISLQVGHYLHLPGIVSASQVFQKLVLVIVSREPSFLKIKDGYRFTARELQHSYAGLATVDQAIDMTNTLLQGMGLHPLPEIKSVANSLWHSALDREAFDALPKMVAMCFDDRIQAKLKTVSDYNFCFRQLVGRVKIELRISSGPFTQSEAQRIAQRIKEICLEALNFDLLKQTLKKEYQLSDGSFLLSLASTLWWARQENLF